MKTFSPLIQNVGNDDVIVILKNTGSTRWPKLPRSGLGTTPEQVPPLTLSGFPEQVPHVSADGETCQNGFPKGKNWYTRASLIKRRTGDD